MLRGSKLSFNSWKKHKITDCTQLLNKSRYCGFAGRAKYPNFKKKQQGGSTEFTKNETEPDINMN
jgi:hypothetical protein